MPRFFIEVSYKGTNYSGFQVQKNGITIQSEVEKALKIYFKKPFSLTGSSRTDAGVHALRNFFHFDLPSFTGNSDDIIAAAEEDLKDGKSIYHLNAILPKDIVIKRIFEVNEKEHCRFDALNREYKYYIYQEKDPFFQDRAYYFPYSLDIGKLKQAASMLIGRKDFTSFSKRNTQVNNFICTVCESEWIIEDRILIYRVKGNRFLRGMVKGLVGTMLKVGTGKISPDQLQTIINDRDCSQADFSVPSHALFLVKVSFI